MTPEKRADAIMTIVRDVPKLHARHRAIAMDLDRSAIAEHIRAAVAAEREACARIAESCEANDPDTQFGIGYHAASQNIAAAIRAGKEGER